MLLKNLDPPNLVNWKRRAGKLVLIHFSRSMALVAWWLDLSVWLLDRVSIAINMESLLQLLRTESMDLIFPFFVFSKKEYRYPKVKFDNGTEMVIVPASWDVERGCFVPFSFVFFNFVLGGKILATRLQVPLCLAWALSIHKCQGFFFFFFVFFSRKKSFFTLAFRDDDWKMWSRHFFCMGCWTSVIWFDDCLVFLIIFFFQICRSFSMYFPGRSVSSRI